MKEVTIKMYKCDYCDKLFNCDFQCIEHEKEIHKCPNCEHSSVIFGYEMYCELHSGCDFQKKKQH